MVVLRAWSLGAEVGQIVHSAKRERKRRTAGALRILLA
jgi:hypothetical protein